MCMSCVEGCRWLCYVWRGVGGYVMWRVEVVCVMCGGVYVMCGGVYVMCGGVYVMCGGVYVMCGGGVGGYVVWRGVGGVCYVWRGVCYVWRSVGNMHVMCGGV